MGIIFAIGCKSPFQERLLLARQSQLTPSRFYTIEFTLPEHENALSSFCRRSILPEQRRFANCCVQEPSCYFCSTLDSRAFPSGWSAKSGLRQRWLAAPRVHLRSPPMLATAETWLLRRHPRAPATSASVGILFSGTLRYGR